MTAHHSNKKVASEESQGSDEEDAPRGLLGVRVVLEELGVPGSTPLSFEIPGVGAAQVSRAICGAFPGASMVVPKPGHDREPLLLGDSEEARGTLGALGYTLQAYAEQRGLSPQQQAIVRLYLMGGNDKEIALELQCAECTVYEHWRRMAKKAGGSHKEDVVTDFHRFLDRHKASERDPEG
jgi:DNA-binding CsgD family transcriptional regulator